MTCANYRVKENSIALTGGTLPFRGGAQLLVRSWALLARVFPSTPFRWRLSSILAGGMGLCLAARLFFLSTSTCGAGARIRLLFAL